mgnify:FL=1
MALNYACNLPKLWELGDLETKRAVQYMVFPDGIRYDFKNKLVQTFRVNEIFGAISSFSDNCKEIEKGTFHPNCGKSPLVNDMVQNSNQLIEDLKLLADILAA